MSGGSATAFRGLIDVQPFEARATALQSQTTVNRQVKREREAADLEIAAADRPVSCSKRAAPRFRSGLALRNITYPHLALRRTEPLLR